MPAEASPEHARANTAVAIGRHRVAHALNIVGELAATTDLEVLLQSVVARVRDSIGLARAVLFLRDTATHSPRLRGSWSIAADGSLNDARSLVHECSASEHSALLRLHRHGQLWQQPAVPALDGAAWLGEAGLDGGWVIATPVTAARRLIGILYNGDGPNTPVDTAKQIDVAILCSSLGMSLSLRPHRLAWHASELPGPRSLFVERVRDAIHETPALRGVALARRFGVSAGHLARAFKREIGVSLVEYRQRLLLGLFFAALDRGHVQLLDAATQAGFGSYGQFHRVYRKLIGAAPHESLARELGAQPPEMSATRGA